MKQKEGFTLFEMVIVLSVLGILTALIVPPLYTLFREAKEKSIAQTVRTLEIALGSFWAQQGAWPLDNDSEPTVFCGNKTEGDPDLLGDFRIIGEEDNNDDDGADDGLFYNHQNKQYIREKDLPVKSVTGGIILYLVEDIVAATAKKRDDIAIVFTVCSNSKGH